MRSAFDENLQGVLDFLEALQKIENALQIFSQRGDGLWGRAVCGF